MSPKVSPAHKQQRRVNLLKAAEEVFIEHGFEKATMKHVMDQAEVSRGGLYQYFSNKEDLFEALIEEKQDEVINGSVEYFIQQQGSCWNALLATFLGDKKLPNDKMDPLAPSKLEYFITGRNEKRRQDHAKKRFQKGYMITQRIIEEGVKAGEFTPKFDPGVIAKSIISHIDGMAIDHAILGSETIQLKEQTELLIEHLKWSLDLKE
ncbi:TetR/AcrR family transcriptional regulator [Falsibacillus pallidus]|uniref:TetR family transcriptional regulator n=1 Tax=Falsibacillus pallidus TaxID=493781 RepID=A0A370G2B2_9BACI|nr:TetR/AcrR family transcriptional regulator [Falsibacillus pallidus]RDI38007.1 TetR family transcriptional regulator [Falsibacillus pallidus]